ncbi:uncharacterized protein LOC123552619, partial [Mercenaria mercenaria]|uniref:uncharacterized protein LOC123552619 n=1 Tax=Mercenaria mercenaria TaxID=6596 RepID=UPI00234F9C6E
ESVDERRLKSSVPEICYRYNGKGCEKDGSCPYIHICLSYVKGMCGSGNKCSKSHNICDPAVTPALGKHGINTKKTPKEILADLQAAVKDNESVSERDEGGNSEVPDEVAYDPYKLLLYKKAIRKGKEKENTLRINIIGNYAQGKTSLANRLIGKTCEGVTTTNGIEINRYKCQTSDDGAHTFVSSENENHEFVSRAASVARSIEQTIKSDKGETDLEENLTYDFLDQTMPEQETSQDQPQPIEISPNVSVEVVANKFNDTGNFVQPVSLQTPQVNEEKLMALSSGEMATFSNVVEVQKDSPEKFFDIWDFGGQYIFYATHALFHSRKALYLLVFDLTKPLDTIVLDEEFPGETGDRNMEHFARFWMESIHAYAGSDPRVILVGTHKDKLLGNDRLWKEYFENIRLLFDDTELINHIEKEDFAVDNHDMSDPGIADLIGFIFKKHEEQVHPVEIPARWMQLEKVLRGQKTPIISFQDVVELDKRNEYPLFDEEQLKLFLHYHHEKGSLFFYDEDQLSDFVCLDPKFLIDAFKCIITSEQFYKNDPDIRSLRKVLSKEGRLTRQLINKVWSNRPDFVEHEGVIIGFLQKQNIISEVAEYDTKSGGKKKKDWFIVPSLLKDHSSKEELVSFLDRKSQSKVRYLMKFDKSSIVHLTFLKALAAALGTWPVLKCGKKRLLFENLCVFKLIKDHAGILEHRKDSKTIELRVINLKSSPVETHPADEFRRFVEAVALNEFRRLKYHLSEKDKPFIEAYRCNHIDHGQEGSSELNDFKEKDDMLCPDNITHDNFDLKRAKEEWTMEFTSEMYPKMQVTIKTLNRLSQVAIGTNWRLLGPQLGIAEAEIDHIKEQHQQIEMQIYQMLLKWKNRSAEKATLDLLVDAIKKCPKVSIYWDEIRNTKDEYVRKLEKLEIDFIQPLSNRTVTVDETLILECKITKPNSSVMWLKDDESITQDARKTISSDGKLHKLVVDGVTVEDAGKYTCAYGTFITECFVKIEDPHGPLKFTKELSDIEAGNIHSTVTFLCELSNSQTEVEWYYCNKRFCPSNKRLYPSKKHAVIDDGSTHMLKIRDVSEEDEGTYSVSAKGLRSKATLYVEETEEERYLLAQHRKKQRDTEKKDNLTKLNLDGDTEAINTTMADACNVIPEPIEPVISEPIEPSEKDVKSEPGLSSDEFKRMKDAAQGGSSKLKEYLQASNNKWRHIPLHIAVTGNAGVGKSSFINAFGGVRKGQKGFAEVGVTETTTERLGYTHPLNKSLVFWDMPGVGTPNCLQNNYLKALDFEKYDFFLILSSGRFTENDLWLANEVRKRKKTFYFIHTQMEVQVAKAQQIDPNRHERDIVAEIRKDCITKLKTAKFEDPTVFLIDNYEIAKYEFGSLVDTLLKTLPERKREAFALSLTVMTKKVIMAKKAALRKRIFVISVASALGGAIPIPGLGAAAIDTAIILEETEEYKRQFGLTEFALLQHSPKYAKLIQDKYCQNIAQIVATITIDEAAENSVKFGMPLLGSIISFSYGVSVTVLLRLLNSMADDALRLNEDMITGL